VATASSYYSEGFFVHKMDSEAAASTGLANAQPEEAQPITGSKRKACDEQADDAAKSAVDAAFANDKPKLVLLLNKYWDQKNFEKMLIGAGVTANDYNKCKKVSGNTVGTLLFETTEQLERVQVLFCSYCGIVAKVFGAVANMRKLFDRDNVQALLSEVEIKGSKLVFEIGESKAKRARDNYSSSGSSGQQSTAPTVSVQYYQYVSNCESRYAHTAAASCCNCACRIL
jgi:hypothetical protein